MKHLILLAVLIVACYGFWSVMADPERATIKGFASRHMPRLVALALLLFLALALAVNFPALNIL